MTSSSRTPFLTIRAEGALLPVDLLQRIVEGRDLDGLSPESYHLSGEKLNEAINRSWNRLLGAWAAFSAGREKLPEGDPGTSVTREKWLLPLFDELDYGRLQAAKAIDIEGKAYAISHGWGEVPIHLVGCGAELDRRTAGVVGAAKASPHSLVQELLNRSAERLWGFVSNGLRLRLLRDNASLTRQAYLEFDLEAMMNGEVYADFVVLWLVCHQSRLESREQRVENCWLEVWSKAAQERGTRALEGLRDGVEQAIAALGKGFVTHAANVQLRAALSSGQVSTADFYRQLLRLVYRLIFLFVAEDRQLLQSPEAGAEARERYARFYSTTRLRRMAERVRGSRHADLFAALKLVMEKLERDGAPDLGLPALGGFLFSRRAVSALADCELSNEHLLGAVRSLAFTIEGRVRRAVDFKNLGARELGSVYESLLELHPLINADAGSFELVSVFGSERKTTGSYFTAEELIALLLDSALNPVIEQALERAKSFNTKDTTGTKEGQGESLAARQIGALLNLKVCDPACGSGHFLIAAARRIARRLAQLRTGEGEPAPEAMRAALREVIANCIYGVDINPMSVELCKVSLWMEALEPGKPLSFLDAHIQCGDSLVGVSHGLNIAEIPDEAFNPAFGDDKATASALKKRNKAERGGQMGLDIFVVNSSEDLEAWIAREAVAVETLPEETAEQVSQKAQSYAEYLRSPNYLRRKLEYDLWTAAFFWKMEAQPKAAGILAPTQEMLRRLRAGGTLPPELEKRVNEIAERLNFLHWELAFPKAFSGENPGFDCIVGNPPWETMQLEEIQFFSARDPQIAELSAKKRKQRIEELTQTNPHLAKEFQDAKHASDSHNTFARFSGRFPLTTSGKLSTDTLFAEHSYRVISKNGMSGLIVPTGITTDENAKPFFSEVVNTYSLIESIGFENEEFLFSGIANVVRFCVFILTNKKDQKKEPIFSFYLRRTSQIMEKERFFTLSPNDLKLLNPNTLTCPVFRTKTDAELTLSVYKRFPIIQNEENGDNPWSIKLIQGLFNLTSDRNLFDTDHAKDDVPIYEAKLFWHFDHRFSSYELKGLLKGRGGRGLPEMPLKNYENPNYSIQPRYWVSKDIVRENLPSEWQRNWLISFRKVTSAKLERTSVFTILPFAGAADTAQLVITDKFDANLLSCFLANCNSIVFDYVSRQKVASTDLNLFIVKQLPVLPPSAYSAADIDFIAPRVLELVYTAYDLRPFAEDMGYHGEPFRWDEGRRAQIRAELDAYYARLYGLTRDELRYILDPKEVHGEDFPGETFRVLKEKEVKAFGEYRTSRLVLEAWDKLGQG